MPEDASDPPGSDGRPSTTPGLHHVTAVVGDAQTALDFYAGTLGLRLVKRTVNFEDVLQYHLYFGNEAGDPGTVFTVFPDPSADPGRVGAPQPSACAFAIPRSSVDYWADRLRGRGVDVDRETDRFGETVLRFADPAGTPLELATAEPDVEPWAGGPVPREHAVRGVRGVTVLPVSPFPTAGLLETLGFDLVGEAPLPDADGSRVRYAAGGGRATVVDVLDREADYGREGPGTHHHVAVRAADEDALHAWRELFDGRGYDVSRVKDRHVFHSLYVREPGGILVELATEEPGLTGADPPEAVADLGESLWLPAWFESDRDLVESQLPELTLPEE